LKLVVPSFWRGEEREEALRASTFTKNNRQTARASPWHRKDHD
jgi:hypothetical protein